MDALLQLGAESDLQAILDSIPYVRFLGVRAEPRGDEITTVLPFSQHLVGNPMLPALHGGVIGAFLEITAVVQLVWQIRSDYLPKTVDIGIDYLRSGRPLETYGRAVVTKHGRRSPTSASRRGRRTASVPLPPRTAISCSSPGMRKNRGARSDFSPSDRARRN